MKFICLPGGFGNAKTFQMQLQPLCAELESDKTAQFFFTQGLFPVTPPPAYDGYFGIGPHYRFIKPDVVNENEVIEAVREIPDLETPEDSMRAVMDSFENGLTYHGIGEAIDMILAIIEQEGDIEGIIGFSEGAMVASSVILEEQRRCLELGIEPRIKCGVFFSGWPPVRASTGEILLLDETEDDMIQIPTCHIMGAADPMIPGAMSLYNLCNMDNAELFDHGHGHLVPREPETLKELGQVIRNMIHAVDTTADSP